MRLLLKYRNKIVSLGLLPIIGTLIGLHLLPNTAVLGAGALISLILLLYGAIRLKTLNFFLLLGTGGIGLCFFVRFFTSYQLIPYGTITHILELLLLIFAFIHITVPELYKGILKKLNLRSSCSFILEAKTIVILSGIHLLCFLVSDIQYKDNSDPWSFFMNYGAPISIYILCLIINIVGIQLALQEEFRYSLIRLVVISDGKIYLTQKHSPQSDTLQWDTPIERRYEGAAEQVDRYIYKIMEQEGIEKTGVVPRHILTHQWPSEYHSPQNVLLYILPLDKEMAQMFQEGKFFSFKEIQANKEQVSPTLQVELKHLEIAARMWRMFGE